MAHNTTCHASMSCAPTENFHGRTPHSALDLKFANTIRLANQTTDMSKTRDEINKIWKRNMHNFLTAYHKYKTYYDKEARAGMLRVNQIVFLLNSQYDDKSSKQLFKSFHWQAPYKVMKALSNSPIVTPSLDR